MRVENWSYFFVFLAELFISQLCFRLVVFMVIILTFLNLVEYLTISSIDFVEEEMAVSFF